MTRSFSIYLKLTLAVLLLQGCVAMGPAPEEAILGTWQTSVGTFPMVVTYRAATVQVGTKSPVAYGLDGNQLTYADGGNQVRLLTFPTASEMIQTDPVTGTEHRFTRVP